MEGGTFRKIGRGYAWIFIIFGLSAVLTVSGSVAAALTAAQVRSTVEQIMAVMLTGKEISPALEQRRKALISMLESGAVKKADIERAIEEAILPIFNHEKTTRYILKELPDRFAGVFSPYLEWEDVRRITWKSCSSVIGEGKRMELKIATLAPEGTPWLNVPQTMLIPQMKELSGGKVIIKLYGGGVMGEDTDILRKMDIGQLEGCGCTALGILAASPETSVFLIPGLFRNYDEVDYVEEKLRKRLDSAFEKRGYILAAILDTGFFYIFSKNQVSCLADLGRQKPLTWFGIVETTLYKELGINATPVAVPEVVSSLSSGLADTNLAPPTWMLGMQAYQYMNYYIKPALLYSPAAVIISTRVRKQLRKRFGISKTLAYNIQELLVFEVNSLEPEWKTQVRSYETKSLKAFETKCGMKAVYLPASDMQLLETVGKKVREELAGKAYPKELADKVIKALKEYRKGR
ncbi:MAG: C4-dicarboxylate ABC transporter substrate-binding protein [Desulfococcus sp. 4484_241]|nr:MAG: C4-dicarboxylate ABC transporter substrate-binding protein [Desulfococcus sp. 4484_241]